ncbi:MAG: hypothetical protein WA777_20005 [Rhodanobacter sp.]
MTQISDHGELDFLTPKLTDDDKAAAKNLMDAIRERRKQINAQDRDREIHANERAITDFHFSRFMP